MEGAQAHTDNSIWKSGTEFPVLDLDGRVAHSGAMPSTTDPAWKPTACILCECNCGIEVQLDDRHITRIRGDKKHPASRGYLCEKAQRLDYYQNGRDRVTQPMRRTPDGGFEAIDWAIAIAEVAASLRLRSSTNRFLCSFLGEILSLREIYVGSTSLLVRRSLHSPI